MYKQVEKPKKNRSSIVVNPLAQKGTHGKRGWSFVDNRPGAVGKSILQDADNNRSTVKNEKTNVLTDGLKSALQQKGCENTQRGDSLNGILQRVVAPSYAAKAPRAPGTPIPTTGNGSWIRPAWLRGESGAVRKLINDLITAGKVTRSPQNSAYIKDYLTGTWVPMTGVNIDHIEDWASFAESKEVADLQQLEMTYHEMDNLQVTASRTNSSNSTTDVLEWMAGEKHEKYMADMGNLQGQERLSGFFQEVVDNNPFMTIQDVPETQRAQFLSYLATIQNPRTGMNMSEGMNGVDLIMAYAHARAIARVDLSDVYSQVERDEDYNE